MKPLAKKVIIYSMLGLMQVGMFSSVAAAAPGPSHNYESQRIAYMDRDDRHGHDNDRKRKHDERQREEKERHEREMKRRPHESDHEWRERQKHENERHENALREIAALLIGIMIGSGSSDN
jgi:ABC-type nickel/cobalt efflux system permease component RcnA